MRSVFSLILIFVFSATSTLAVQAEGFFKWKDKHGRVQYGDKPPEHVKVERFKMPEITVIEGYGKQWQPIEPVASNQSKSPVVTAPAIQKTATQQAATVIVYTKFAFIAPKNGQTLSGGFKGEVSAMLSLKPPLKKGHKIVFSLNGKPTANGTSRISNFSNLKGGSHTVSASIVDQAGRVVMNTGAVTFNVLRKRRHQKDELPK